MVLLLEVLTLLGVLPGRFLPPPSEVLGRLALEVQMATFWTATWQTVLGWALGLLIAMAIAIPVGITLASSNLIYFATRPIVEFLRPVPSVALIPLVFLVFSPTMEGKVFLAAYAATWPLLVQTQYGIRSVQSTQRDTARSFQIAPWRVIMRVVMPSALPYIATGLRISSTVSLILVVSGEIILGAPGIGQQINLAREGGDFAAMYAFVVVAGLVGLALNAIFARVERRLLHWHPSQRNQTI
ncbi:ABC transporter permease [Microbacterium sp.]|uniref:ABC transporter permease n=1 Tax=Microbacterium sp. TaxID=51671 RepID=UPI003A8388DE